jgi:hypothetical protein
MILPSHNLLVGWRRSITHNLSHEVMLGLAMTYTSLLGREERGLGREQDA